MKKSIAALALALGTFTLTGCRTYTYEIVQPPQLAATVAGQPVTASLAPLEYQFSRVQDRLAIRITNPTDDRITLVGEKSYVVDPEGQSHVLPGAAIGPRSHIVMYLPPRPQRVQARTLGVGLGAGYGMYAGPWSPGAYWGAYYDPLPLYYGPSVTTFDVQTPFDWRWKTGVARLSLLFERAGEPFEHKFEFNRGKS